MMARHLGNILPHEIVNKISIIADSLWLSETKSSIFNNIKHYAFEDNIASVLHNLDYANKLDILDQDIRQFVRGWYVMKEFEVNHNFNSVVLAQQKHLFLIESKKYIEVDEVLLPPFEFSYGIKCGQKLIKYD